MKKDNSPKEVVSLEIVENSTIKHADTMVESMVDALKNIDRKGKINISVSSEKQVLSKTTNDGLTTEVFTHEIFSNTTISSHSVTHKTTIEARRESVERLSSTKSQGELADILGVSQSTISKDLKRIKESKS